MEEEQKVPAPEPKKETAPKKPSKDFVGGKKPLIIAIVILLFILIGGGAYSVGSRKGQREEEVSPTPTQEEASPTPEETAGAESSPAASPTASPIQTPSPTPRTPPTQTKIISSNASLDGFRSSNGGGNTTVDIRTGRNIYLVTRGFISFDLSGVPSGAVIEGATLRVYQVKIIGDPYGVGARVMVDHLDYGSSLESADYGASSISSSFATLTNNATIEWKDADVTDALKNDLSNGRSPSQYRIHLAIESTGGTDTGDFSYFESADNSEGTGNTPQLVVKYH